MNIYAIIIIPAYILAIVVAISIIGRKNKSYEEFSTASKALPWYVAAGSMLAALIGGGTMIGYVGSYYNFGMQWAWMGIGCSLALFMLAFYLSERIKNMNQSTVSDIFYARYGMSARRAAALVIMIADFGGYCTMVSSFATIISGYVGIPLNISLIITIVVFFISVNMGGLKGVAYTDLVQSFLIVFGVILVGSLAFSMAGGFQGWATLGSKYTSLFTNNIPPLKMVGNVLGLISMTLVSQSCIVQKLSATRSPRDAKKAVVAVAIASVLMIVMFISSMGISSRVIFGDSIDKSNNVIVTLLSSLNPLIASFYAAAIVAAVLTTANACLLSSSVTFTKDVLKPFVPNMSDKSQFTYSRIFLLVASILGLVVVKFIPSVITLIMLVYSVQSALLVPLYGGLFIKRISGKTGFITTLVSLAAALAWEVLGSPFGIHSAMVSICTGIITFVIAILIDKKGATEEQRRMVDAFITNTPYIESQSEA